MNSSPNPITIVFDLGGVLIDWDPRYLFRKLIPDDKTRDHFLREICSPAWNERQDQGRKIDQAVAELVQTHPRYEAWIRAYYERWEETIGGPIRETVLIVEELAASGCRMAALTNWSAETFPVVRAQYRFFDHFEQIVVSGEEGIAKPDARIYQALLERIGCKAEDCLFIDDSPRNIEAAQMLGLQTILFSSPSELREALVQRRLLP